jgi:hypothetical protein
MELIKEEEKRKKFNTGFKTNKYRGYNKARNRSNKNSDEFNNYQTFSYNTKNKI